QHIIDVLRGQRTEKVLQRGHDSLSTFGIGGELDEGQWRAVLRQLITMHFIKVDHDNYGVLKLTEESRAVLKGERRLTLRRDTAPAGGGSRRRRRSGARVDGSAAAATPQEEALFQALRDWRKGVAQEHGVPAYTVLHDATLREIARQVPADLQSLGNISGMGTTKLERYGEALLELVREATETGPIAVPLA